MKLHIFPIFLMVEPIWLTGGLYCDTVSGIDIGGLKITVPTEAIENREIDDKDIQSFSSGG